MSNVDKKNNEYFQFQKQKFSPTYFSFSFFYFNFCNTCPGFSEISSCVSAYFRTTLRRARSRDARACVYFRSVNEVMLKGALSTRSTFCRSGQRSGPSCHAFCSGAFIKSELPVGKLRRPSSVLRLGFHLADFGSPPSRARGATGYNRGSMTGWTNCNIHTQESKRLVYICFSILQFCFVRVGLACAALSYFCISCFYLQVDFTKYINTPTGFLSLIIDRTTLASHKSLFPLAIKLKNCNGQSLDNTLRNTIRVTSRVATGCSQRSMTVALYPAAQRVASSRHILRARGLVDWCRSECTLRGRFINLIIAAR